MYILNERKWKCKGGDSTENLSSIYFTNFYIKTYAFIIRAYIMDDINNVYFLFKTQRVTLTSQLWDPVLQNQWADNFEFYCSVSDFQVVSLIRVYSMTFNSSAGLVFRIFRSR